MQRVGGSKVGECRGKIMLLEVEQADRSGRDASARSAGASSAMQKNWGQFAHPVSRNQVKVESCSSR